MRLNLRSFDGDRPSSLSSVSLTASDNNLHQHGKYLSTMCGYMDYNYFDSYADVDTWSFSTTFYWAYGTRK